MKKIILALACAAGVCALSGCTSDALKQKQQQEDKALVTAHAAERQAERAQNMLAGATVSKEAAQANLTAKQQKQEEADQALQALLCPSQDPAQ